MKSVVIFPIILHAGRRSRRRYRVKKLRQIVKTAEVLIHEVPQHSDPNRAGSRINSRDEYVARNVGFNKTEEGARRTPCSRI